MHGSGPSVEQKGRGSGLTDLYPVEQGSTMLLTVGLSHLRQHNPAFYRAFTSQAAQPCFLRGFHLSAHCTAGTTTFTELGMSSYHFAVHAWRSAKQGVLKRDATGDKLSLSLFHDTFSNCLPLEAPLSCHHVAHSLLRRELASRTDTILWCLQQCSLYTQQVLCFGKYLFPMHKQQFAA